MTRLVDTLKYNTIYGHDSTSELRREIIIIFYVATKPNFYDPWISIIIICTWAIVFYNS